MNRTVGQAYPDGTRVTNTFDVAGQQLTQQDVTGIRSFSWDLDGRQTSVVYPSGQALTYSFDADSNRVGLVDPDGGLTTYSWDIQNRLVGIVNPFAEYTTITWDALDRELRKTLGNGLSVSHTYDAAGRETLLENRTATGAALAIFTNTYDAIGNRLSVLELDGTRCTFGYDSTYQLVNEQRSGSTPYNTTFQYDGVGNRLLKNDSGQVTTYTFNSANELLSSQMSLSTMAYQVDSGGGSAAGSFQADAFYSSPATLHTFTIPTSINMSGVTNPAPEAVYQTILYLDNSTTGPLNYTLTGLTPNADYRVRLHFATNVDGSAGQRSMNVFMNDQIVLSGLDVYAEAGGDKTALVKELVGTANGAGTLVVSLTGDPTKTWIARFINGIEVLPWFYEINCGGAAAGSARSMSEARQASTAL